MLADAPGRTTPVTPPIATPLTRPAAPPPVPEPQRLAQAGDVAGARALIRRDPSQIDAVLQQFAQHRPGLVPDVVSAAASTIERRPPARPQADEPSLGTRIWGGVRALGGGLEAAVGGGLLLVPEPTMLTKAGGVVVGAHGIDNLQAGVRQAWTGRETETLTQQGVTAGAEAVGIDPKTARVVGLGVDIGVGFIGGGAAGLARASNGSRLVWNSIKATQPLYEGTAIPRSFTLAAGRTSVWVHGNGTKHIAEYANKMLREGHPAELVHLTSQLQLTSLQSAVRTAGQQGIQLEQMMKVGGWELIFSAPRAGQTLPVLKHALPLRSP